MRASMRLTGRSVAGTMVSIAFALGCGRGAPQPVVAPPPGTADGGDDGSGNKGPDDAGSPDASSPDASTPDASTPDASTPDAGSPDAGSPDAGSPDAGSPDAGNPDAGLPDGGASFGGPGPWPLENVAYATADGLLSGDLGDTGVVAMSTDETQNLWFATRSALYVLQPGDKTFRRYAAGDGLHLPGNPVVYCDSSFQDGDRSCPIEGAASPPGISEITGGGPNEVFVGYFSEHDWNDPADGTWGDKFRHMGKVDRVRLQPGGKIEVVRFDLVSGNTPMYWHNRTIYRLVYDHFIHKHELYVGTEHGIDKISPDKWFPPDAHWPYADNLYWMSDHLHPRVCLHEWCTGDESKDTQMMGEWRGMAIAPDGDLWVGGKWSAGKIVYTALAAGLGPDGKPDPRSREGWFQRPGAVAFSRTFGDWWCGSAGQVKKWTSSGWQWSSCTPGEGTPPIFQPPMEGDPVYINAVAVTPDGKSWWTSPQYGIASVEGNRFTYYSPRDLGVAGTITDMVALPDGRLAIGADGGGVTFWNPATGARTSIRGGSGLLDDRVNRLELDRMVEPPALHVSTRTGAATIRVFP